MLRCRKQPFGWVFVSRMIGIISFLIVIVLANILGYYITSPLYHAGVLFLNENFWLLLLICVIFFFGDIFAAFPFPLNLPAPIIKAIGSIFCMIFILGLFQWVDTMAATNLYRMFFFLSFLIVPLVFLIVLASGYFEIMRQLWWMPKLDDEGDDQIVHQAKEVNSDALGSDTLSDAKSWEEIGIEFRLMLYDLMHRFRQEIKRK
jgi:hypothetical protein